MMLSQTLMAACSMTLAITTRSGHITPAIMYVVIALGGAALALDSPARQSLIPLLVPRAHLANALSLHAMAWEIAAIAGPSLAGLIIAWRGVFPVYVLDAASFAAVLAALLAMHHRAPPRASANISIAAAIDGLRFLARTPLILSTMVLDAVATFFAGSLLLLPVYADQHPHRRSARPRPVLRRAAGRRRDRRHGCSRRDRRSIARAPPSRRRSRSTAPSVAAFGVSSWLPLSLLLLAISGAADTVSMVVRQTLRQLLTPDELRGRMTSVNMIFFIGGPQLGEFEAGVVARAAGAAHSRSPPAASPASSPRSSRRSPSRRCAS